MKKRRTRYKKTFTRNYLIVSLGPQSYSLIIASIAPNIMAAASHKELNECIKSMATQKYAISETFIFQVVENQARSMRGPYCAHE